MRAAPLPALLAALLAVSLLAGCGPESEATWPGGIARFEGDGKPGVEQGDWLYRYPDGQPREAGRYRSGRRIGVWTQWHRNGQRATEGERSWVEASGASERQGEWLTWHENGTLRSRGRWVDGERQGPWEFWLEQGAVDEKRSGRYEDGRKIRTSEQGGEGQ